MNKGGGVVELVACPPTELKTGSLNHLVDRHFLHTKNLLGPEICNSGFYLKGDDSIRHMFHMR
jgi:hypothetical protein